MKDLTKLEEVILVAIFRLDEEAYGVNIKNQIKQLVGRDYFYSTLYSTFEQLVRKGYLSKHFGDPTAVRGGKRKVFFHLTKTGHAVLMAAFERQRGIWDGITEELLKKDFAG